MIQESSIVISNIPILSNLINDINNCKTIVFCGAGISRDSGLPVVNQIVPYILNKLDISKEDNKIILDKDNNLKIPFESFIEIVQMSCNTNKLFEVYEKGFPNANHILLSKLIKENKIKTIVTTNFDRLIEEALLMQPKPLVENIDYDLFYYEQDFGNINWNEDRIRIIKIHGSIDDKDAMAATIKQVANKCLSDGRLPIIENIFSKGLHKSVLILGYSSSDIFDLTPHIQSINKNKSIYYIEHIPLEVPISFEDIRIKKDKNPFRKYEDSWRIYCNTNVLIENIWKYFFIDAFSENKLSKNDWRNDIDRWYRDCINKYSNIIKFSILANLFEKYDINKKSIKYHQKALQYAIIQNDKINILRQNDYLVSCYVNNNNIDKAIEHNRKILDYSSDNWFVDKIFCENYATILLHQNKAQEAIEYFQIANKLENKTDICFGSFNLAISYYHISEFELAIKYYLEALDGGTLNGYKRLEEGCLGMIGKCYLRLGNFNKAQKYYEKAKDISIKLGSRFTEGLWIDAIGETYFCSGNNIKALEEYKLAFKIIKKYGNKLSLANLLGHIAATYLALGDIEKSINKYNEAIKITCEIESKEIKAGLFSGLGEVYLRIGQYVDSKELFEQALDISIDIKDRYLEEIIRGNLGNIYLATGDNTSAQKYFKEALNISKEINDVNGEAKWLCNLGSTYFDRNDCEAKKYYDDALERASLINNKTLITCALSNIGAINLKLFEYDIANKQLQEALKLSIESGDKYFECFSTGTIGRLLEEKENYSDAIKYYTNAIDIASEKKYNLEKGMWLGNLASVYLKLNNKILAKNHSRQSLDILLPIVGPNHSLTKYFSDIFKDANK